MHESNPNEYLYQNISPLNLDILHNQIAESSLSTHFLGLSSEGNSLWVETIHGLDESEKLTLDGLITTHSQTLPSNFNYQLEVSKYSQEANIAFAVDLLHTWIRKNTLEGMSVVQSLWVFSRFEDFTITSAFGTKKVDLFKMFTSGALPTVYYCLLRLQPDDMTESYHWITQTRIDWVKGKVEERLGAGMVSYLQSLS